MSSTKKSSFADSPASSKKEQRGSTKTRERESTKSGGRGGDGKSQKTKRSEGPAAGTVIKTGQSDESVASRRGGSMKGGSEKSKRKGRTADLSGKNKAPEKKKRRGKGNKKSVFEKLASMFGIYLGNVQLRDPRALEAAQALDLQQWHIRKLRSRFDKIDIDGSGNIDLEEFFEAVNEERSPFTDKLFALIGKYHSYCISSIDLSSWGVHCSFDRFGWVRHH